MSPLMLCHPVDFISEDRCQYVVVDVLANIFPEERSATIPSRVETRFDKGQRA